MKYINTKTGVLLDTSVNLSGGDWVIESENKKEKAKEEPKKSEPKK